VRNRGGYKVRGRDECIKEREGGRVEEREGGGYNDFETKGDKK
jgi:hypothetical protein